jgi:hypothetical protein
MLWWMVIRLWVLRMLCRLFSLFMLRLLLMVGMLLLILLLLLKEWIMVIWLLLLVLPSELESAAVTLVVLVLALTTMGDGHVCQRSQRRGILLYLCG